jgi:hypothetical protein
MDEKLPREAIALVALHALLPALFKGNMSLDAIVHDAFVVADMFKQKADGK